MAELDKAQRGDRLEIVGGADANVDVDHDFGGPSRLGREHAPAAEAGVVERGAERVEVDMVDREPHRTVSKKRWRQSSEESDDDGRRVGEIGIDGQPVRRNETNRVRRPPAHHPDASALVVSDETDVAIDHQLVQRDAAVLRVGVRSGHPQSMGTGSHLLTGNDRRSLVDGDAVQDLNSQHRRSGATHRLAAVALRPSVDHELPTVRRDDRERVDVDREQIPVLWWIEAALRLQPGPKRRQIAGIGGQHGCPADLGVSRADVRGAVAQLPRVPRDAVQCDPWVAAQVLTLAGPRHRPDTELAVVEVRIGAAQPWRAITTDGSQHRVRRRRQDCSDAIGEVRLVTLDIGKAGHQPSLADGQWPVGGSH